MQDELVRHVGGSPSGPQALLINRIVQLQWQCVLLDRAAVSATGEAAVQLADRAVIMANALGRTLARLGLDAAPPPPPKLLTPRQIMNLDPR